MKIDAYLREHRQTFERSDAQRKIRAMDYIANMNSQQAPSSPKGTQWFPSCPHFFQALGSPRLPPRGVPHNLAPWNFFRMAQVFGGV